MYGWLIAIFSNEAERNSRDRVETEREKIIFQSYLAKFNVLVIDTEDKVTLLFGFILLLNCFSNLTIILQFLD